jgi:hypothetical protein
VQFFESLAHLMSKTATVSETKDNLAAPMGRDSAQNLDSFEEDGRCGQALLHGQWIERVRGGLSVAGDRLCIIGRQFPFLLSV